MKNKKMILGSSILLVVLLVIGGTMAWFTASTDPITNNFTAGTLTINLVDEFEGAQNVNPGDCFEKEVYVENTGTKQAFVRIKKDIAFDKVGLDLDVVEYTLGEGWEEHNGYFYYTQALAAKDGDVVAKTTNLFAANNDGKNICFNGPNMDNDYQGAQLDIVVEAEAIQVTNGAAEAEWGVYPPSLAPTPEPSDE